MNQCNICHKQFFSYEALVQHTKSAHNKELTEKKSSSTFVWGIAIVLLLVVGGWFYLGSSGEYDDFAKCISSSGAKFYGAFWCPHCIDQKKMFGSSAKYLPYVECSSSDGNSQLAVCQQAGIQGYPTWVFADGSQANLLSLEELSRKTNCPISN